MRGRVDNLKDQKGFHMIEDQAFMIDKVRVKGNNLYMEQENKEPWLAKEIDLKLINI